MALDIKQITEQLLGAFTLEALICKDLGTPTNDVVQVIAQNKRFALKLYTVTTSAEVQWEIDLLLHLLRHDVPVVRPVRGRDGYLNTFMINDEERVGVCMNGLTVKSLRTHIMYTP